MNAGSCIRSQSTFKASPNLLPLKFQSLLSGKVSKENCRNQDGGDRASRDTKQPPQYSRPNEDLPLKDAAYTHLPMSSASQHQIPRQRRLRRVKRLWIHTAIAKFREFNHVDFASLRCRDPSQTSSRKLSYQFCQLTALRLPFRPIGTQKKAPHFTIYRQTEQDKQGALGLCRSRDNDFSASLLCTND